MLLGTYPAKLATNHRIALPAQLRHELGDKLIIAKWYEERLVILAKSTLNSLLTRIIGTSSLITEPVRGSEHFIFSSAYELTPDDQGRIIIPEGLIAYARLPEDVYFLGVGDRVEVWGKQIWDEREKIIMKEAPSYIENLAKNEKR